MTPLSQEQIKQLQNDMSDLLAKHGMTGGYLVAESRKGDDESAHHTVVAVSAVPPFMPTLFLDAMAKQTYNIVRSVGKMEVKINDN